MPILRWLLFLSCIGLSASGDLVAQTAAPWEPVVGTDKQGKVTIRPSVKSRGYWFVRFEPSGSGQVTEFEVWPGTPLPPTSVGMRAANFAIVRSFENELRINGDVVIIDLKARTVADWFMATFPSVSADGRYVVLLGRLARDEEVSALPAIVLYDVLKSPESNRPDRSLPRYRSAGVPVYPASARKARSYSEQKAAENASDQLASNGFTWLSDREVAFGYRHKDELRLVVLQIAGEGADTVRVALDRPINFEPLLRFHTASVRSQVSIADVRKRLENGRPVWSVQLGPANGVTPTWLDVKP